MAVSQIRALLTAHAQVAWKRSELDLGKRGLRVTLLAGILVGSVVTLPVLIVFMAGGYALGIRLLAPAIARLVGGVLMCLALIGGIVARAGILDWERMRLFPTRVRTILIAELLAGLTDPIPMLFALSAGALLLGIVAAQPRALALIAIPWSLTVVTLLSLRQCLAGFLSLTMRHIGASLLTLAALVASVAILASGSPRLSQSELTLLLDYLPWVQSVQGLGDATAGRWGFALSRQVPALAATIMLLAVTATIRKRERLSDRARAVRFRSAQRLWSFSSPVQGIAILHLISLLRSTQGLIALVSPLVVMSLFRGMLPASVRPSVWLPATLLAIAITDAMMHLNQFGLDGSSVTALMLLPVTSVDLLKGKAWGLAIYQSVQLLLAVLMISLAASITAMSLLSAVVLSGCLFFYSVGIGHWTSVETPRAIPRNILKQSMAPAPALVLMCLAVTVSGAALFGSSYLIAFRWSPVAMLSLQVMLLVAMIVVYQRWLLPYGARRLSERRETIARLLV